MDASQMEAVNVAPRMGNFKAMEDVLLATAYVTVTRDAAVGTDQDGNTFWNKIRDHFIRRGGLPGRTLVSLKNRFNKVLQAEVNKYIGYLHTVLREYHSGWGVGDYVKKAKTTFLMKLGKPFKHDEVYDVLRKHLPKYEIDLALINSSTARALFLLDSDAAMNEERLMMSHEEIIVIKLCLLHQSNSFHVLIVVPYDVHDGWSVLSPHQ